MKINFAHNVYDRPNTLKKTIEIERNFFPKCGIFISYNNEKIRQELLDIGNVLITYFSEQTHKIGCSNGVFHAVRTAKVTNPDVIIFSHDDVSITNIELVKKHIESIVTGEFDFIARTPANLPDIGKEYVMMESMFFSPKAVEKMYPNGFKPFNKETDIEKDLRGSISPEVNMYNLSQKIDKKKIMMYNHGNDPLEYNKTLNETLGYTHEKIGQRGWKE